MPWKEDEDGSLLRDEETKNPIWVADDGKELPVDADRSFKKIAELNTESAGRRKALEAAQARLKILDGIDNPEEYLSEAREALEKIKALDGKELLDTGKVDALTAQIKESYEGKLKEKDKAIQSAHEKLTAREQEINDYMLGRELAASTFLNDATVWSADVVQARYGKTHFKIENGQVVGIWPETGEPIYSDARPGELATVDEVIEKIINKRSDKDKILRSVGATGAGTEGNRTGQPASKWGHIKNTGDFRNTAERSAFIDEVGLEKFKKLPPPAVKAA